MIREIVLLAVLMVPTQCGGPDRSVGGDNNPRTGECTIEFEETVGGTLHRYPHLADPRERLVIGKVIMVCPGRRPATQRSTAYLETRRPGAGQDWRERYQISTAFVPNPKEALFVKADCDKGAVAYWRVRVKIVGTVVQADGRTDHFDEEATSREARIQCP